MNQLKLAGCIILNENHHILLLHRNTPKRTHWEIPGGKIEANEVSSIAAAREMKEELGVQVKIIKLLGAKSFNDEELVIHYSWFLAQALSRPRIMEPEIFDDLGFFPSGRLRDGQMTLSYGVQSFLGLLESISLQEAI